MSELDDVRAEVAALRDEVANLRDEAADTRALAAMADRDAAGMRGAVGGITKVQNALRATQVEHGHTMEGIAQAVGVLVTGQTEMTSQVAALAESVQAQNATLAQHGAALAQHGAALAEHGAALAEQGAALAEQGVTVAQLADGQAEILRRLPPPAST